MKKLRFFLRESQFFCIFAAFLTTLIEGSTHMKKGLKHKSKESAEREKKHQFGQPDGNPQGGQSIAVNQREFYRWVECKATKAELEAYIKDESHPWSRIHFCEMWLKNNELDDAFAMTNQTHGAPKQPIEVQSLPKIELAFFRRKK